MAAPMNFAAMAAKPVKEAKAPLQRVQLEGQVVLKIAKHCKENEGHAISTGQLLGLDVGSTLEVTDCFPYPVRSGGRAAAAARRRRVLTVCCCCAACTHVKLLLQVLVAMQHIPIGTSTSRRQLQYLPVAARPAPTAGRALLSTLVQHPSLAACLLLLLQGNPGEEHEEVGEGESYQLEMMRCLREINADSNTVGWCVSTCFF